jgi:hypothetical protein
VWVVVLVLVLVVLVRCCYCFLVCLCPIVALEQILGQQLSVALFERVEGLQKGIAYSLDPFLARF